MLTKQCDRCQKLCTLEQHRKAPATWIQIKIETGYSLPDTIDLCIACADKFYFFFTGKTDAKK